MQSSIKKWGNSPSIRIPSFLMKAAGLHINQAVEIHEINGKLIIEAVAQPEYSLDSLVDEITADNLHHAVDTGDAMGKEDF